MFFDTQQMGCFLPLGDMSVMELPHGLLKVGVELGHAAREEGVYHALWEVATQVCLEERDQLGFVGLPEKTNSRGVVLDMYHRGIEAQSHDQRPAEVAQTW